MTSPRSSGRRAILLMLVIAVGAVVADGAVPPPPGAAQPTTKPIVTTAPAQGGPPGVGTETIVFLRHGEKPARGLGQLSPQGLNRALALSAVLPAKYGKPDFLFAPDPAMTKVADGGPGYYYIRPLATIEPTAIALGMPVQTPFGYAEIDKLEAELSKPKYAQSLVFVAWEHGYGQEAAASLVGQFGGDPAQVPRLPAGPRPWRSPTTRRGWTARARRCRRRRRATGRRGCGDAVGIGRCADGTNSQACTGGPFVKRK
jgi:hypothetical protein